MATIAVGPTHALRRVLQALPDVLARPVANLERIAVVKHDGDLLEPLPLIYDSGHGRPPGVDGAPRIHPPVRTGPTAAPSTPTSRGGYERRAPPGSPRCAANGGSPAMSGPSATASARWRATFRPTPSWSTAPARSPRSGRSSTRSPPQHGVVTAALVPAYRERAGSIEHGQLTVRSAHDVAEFYRSHASPDRARRDP